MRVVSKCFCGKELKQFANGDWSLHCSKECGIMDKDRYSGESYEERLKRKNESTRIRKAR